MIQVNLQSDTRWFSDNASYCCGSAFTGRELLRDSTLLQHFSGGGSVERFIAALESLNGFFALIHKSEDKLFAATDRVRSIPLFYGQLDGLLLLSDDAGWIRQRLGNRLLDELAVKEFIRTGYVTGRDTLDSCVKQLQAGECLIATTRNGHTTIELKRYYTFERNESNLADDQALLAELEDVILHSMTRLVQWANGRPIIVPLSGGYDSRLILSYLKKLKYPKIIAFTYGRPGNNEAKISREVARQLNVQWLFVEYSNKRWQKWFHTQERQEYFGYAHQLTSVPHIQDWPAVWELRNQGHLPPDAVFVPGHTGDFIAGGHTIHGFLKESKVGRTS